MRRLPPVRSPISPGAILAGVRSAASSTNAASVRRSVETQLSAQGSSILLTDSGTTALALALRHSMGTEGRPVALPAYACFDIATAADAAGVPFVLYDIDPLTLGPDWGSLRGALAVGADRLVVVHAYGLPVDMDRVRALAARFSALVIEDAAQGIGASWAGAPAGSSGSLGVLSFGRGKGMTGGRGGALMANDARGEVVMRSIGRLADARSTSAEVVAIVAQWLLARPTMYWIPQSLPFLGLGETKYRIPHPPSGPSPFSLGVLQRSIAAAGAETTIRRRNADILLASLDGESLRPFRGDEKGQPGYLRLPVIASGAARTKARSASARNLGVMPGYPRALSSLGGFGDRRMNSDAEFPGATSLAESLFTMPTHGALSGADLQRIATWAGARR